MSRPTVLVTGIGGNVGQGVLRVLRDLPEPLTVVGTDIAGFSGGNHLCDGVAVVPFAWEDEYLDALEKSVRHWEVDLILPATDHETAVLAAARDRFPTVAASPASTAAVFLDKLRTAAAFTEAGLPFARTSTPAQYLARHPEGFASVVVKPREGRGSRGLAFDPPDPTAFDETHVVQERHLGPEITIGFYVRADGELHGFVVLERTLRNGTTQECRVVHDHDDAVGELLAGLCGALDIRGSCNVQAIVTDEGPIPFEVNGRISGTASIRHRLGFRDVAWTLDEHLWGRAPAPPETQDGCATRLLMDVVYPEGVPGPDLMASSPHEVF